MAWRRRGDSNPRYPNRVRQFSKLLVSATHPPLRVFCLTKKHRFSLSKSGAKVQTFSELTKNIFLFLHTKPTYHCFTAHSNHVRLTPRPAGRSLPHPPPRSPAPVFHPTLQSVISSHPAPEKLSPHQKYFAFFPLKKGRTYRTTRKRRRSITIDSLLASAIYRDCTSMSKYRIICAITATEPHAVRAIHRFFFISKHVIRKIFVYLQSVNPLNPEHINNIKTIE